MLKKAINPGFIKNISNKYGNKITVAQYIIERIKYNNIDCAFVAHDKNTSKLLSPIETAASQINDFKLIHTNSELHSFYSTLTYCKAFNKMGVCINTTESNFDEFKDLLYVTKPILSICIFNNLNDLSNTIKNTESIHSCFLETYTMHNSQNVPNVLEFMISQCTNAPVHLNISKILCYQRIH